MNTRNRILGALALTLGLTATALAGPTDGSRQVVSPPAWQSATEGKASPYALTGTRPENRPSTAREQGWTREVQRLGNKVQIDTLRR